MKINKIIPLVLSSIFILTGCAQKNLDVRNDKMIQNIIKHQKQQEEKDAAELFATNPYQLTIKPIVGSEQDDARVIVDMGKILKIWVAPYVIGSTLIAAHDIYTWVQPPHFIAGESLPNPNQTTGLVTPDHNYPIIFRPEEVWNRPATFSNEELKKYVNNVYKVAKNPEIANKKIQMVNKQTNKQILNFIKKDKQNETIKNFIKDN